MEPNKQNAPLWFIGGLLLGGSPLIGCMLSVIGVVSIIFIVAISSIFSAVIFATVTHWKTLLLFVIFGSVFALLGYLYLLEEKKKRENKG